MAKTTQPRTKTTKKPVAKKPAKKVDLSALDGSRDDTALNGSASGLAEHAEALALAAQRNVRALAKAEVSGEDATTLTALAGALRTRETAWSGSSAARSRRRATR